MSSGTPPIHPVSPSHGRSPAPANSHKNTSEPLPSLELDSVDAHNSPLNHPGHLTIKGDVKDNADISADGNIQIHGPIEDAALRCGGDLTADRGFAGKNTNNAEAQVAGNFTAHFLNHTAASVRGDLTVQKEILHCSLDIHGSLIAPAAPIIGGNTTVLGTVDIQSLGSEAGIKTRLAIGSVPSLESYTEKLQALIDALNEKNQKHLKQQEVLDLAMGRLTNAQKEQQTELMFAHANTNDQLQKARDALAAIRRRIDRQRVIDLTIRDTLHIGVTLVIGRTAYIAEKDIKGALRITLGPDNRTHFEHKTAPNPVTDSDPQIDSEPVISNGPLHKLLKPQSTLKPCLIGAA